MRGGFRYSKKRVVKGKGLKNKYRTPHKRHNKELKNKRRTAKCRQSIQSQSIQKIYERWHIITPAVRLDIDGGVALNVYEQDTIIRGGQPSAGPYFNTPGGHKYEFKPSLGGTTPNTQCTTDY